MSNFNSGNDDPVTIGVNSSTVVSRAVSEMGDKTDLQLFELIGQGNKAAMAGFIQRYYRKITDFIARQLGRQPDIEDIAQEAFIKVWQHAPNWIYKDIPPHSWLYRITYNLCVDLLRKRRPIDNIDMEQQVSQDDLPEEYLYKNERIELLAHAFNLLSQEQKTAISLCNYQGFTNREAAEIMQISVEALESLLARGRRKLKMILVNH